MRRCLGFGPLLRYPICCSCLSLKAQTHKIQEHINLQRQRTSTLGLHLIQNFIQIGAIIINNDCFNYSVIHYILPKQAPDINEQTSRPNIPEILPVLCTKYCCLIIKTCNGPAMNLHSSKTSNTTIFISVILCTTIYFHSTHKAKLRYLNLYLTAL